MSLIRYAIFVGLGVMLGITLVDMSVGSESTIGNWIWHLF
jgi:hypothetical protein